LASASQVALEVGEALALVPRHVCTTVAAHDRALLVRDGRVVGSEPVDARRREPELGPDAQGAAR